MSLRLLSSAALAFSLILSSSGAQAALVTYKADGFTDGGTLSGTFTIDNSRNVAVTGNLTLTPTNDYASTLSFTNLNDSFTTVDAGGGKTYGVFYDTARIGADRTAQLQLIFAYPAGGNIILTDSVMSADSFFTASSDGSYSDVQGTVALKGAAVSAVPLPASLSLFLTGLGLLAAFAAYKQAVLAQTRK